MEHLKELLIDNTKYTDWLNLATTCRKGNVEKLKLIKNEIEKSYLEYDTIINEYSVKIDETNFSDHSEILLEYYNKPPSSLNVELKDRRNNHGLNECPFCGNPTSPDTLDHFLPKNFWPEYSIFQNNLVPQCRGCAPTKGDKYFCSTNNSAMFIHPMYDDLISKVGFNFYIKYDDSNNRIAIDVKFSLPRDLDSLNESKNRIETHLTQLKIKQRAIIFAHRTIRHWKNLLKKNDFDILVVLNSRLSERATEQRYRNWESALYQSIIDNDELIKYLKSLQCQDRKIDFIEERIELDL